MKEQLQAIFWVLVEPKETLRGLPSNRVYALGILAPLLMGLSRAYHPQRYGALRAKLGGDLPVFVFVTVAVLVMIPFGAWLTQLVLRAFKKRLSLVKLINIYGYSLVPQLLVGLLGAVMVVASPDLLTKQPPSIGLIVIMLLGIAAIVHSMWLYVYGLIVSPSEERSAP